MKTEQMQELVVTHADREAAWPFRAECFGHADKAGWDCGKYDHARSIQAFARHRLAATERMTNLLETADQHAREGWDHARRLAAQAQPEGQAKRSCLTPGFKYETSVEHARNYRSGRWLRVSVIIRPPMGKGMDDSFNELNDRFFSYTKEDADELRDAVHNAIEPIIARISGLAALATLSTVPQHGVGELLDWFSEQRQLELFYHTPTYCDDDDQAREWRVVQRSGRINDREWKIVGHGSSATDAVISARAALAGIGAGQEGEGL